MGHEEMGNVVATLCELKEDITVPKNVRLKVEKVMGLLNEETEIDIKVSKALNELEEIADDVNLQSYTRAQVWSVISTLEKIK